MTRENFENELESRVADVNSSFEQVESAASCSCSDDDLDDAIDKAEVEIENIENSLRYLKDALQRLKELKSVDVEEEDE